VGRDRLDGVAVVRDLDRDGVIHASDAHLGVRRARVLEDVGQCLLDDPVDGHVHRRGQGRATAVDLETHRQARRADALGQRGQLTQARLRGELGLLVGLAQDDEQAPHLAQRLPPALLDFLQGPRQRLPRGLGPGGLQDHHAEMMRDDVVQFAGDPGSLGGHRPLGLALQRRVVAGQRRCLPAGADEQAGQPANQDFASQEQARGVPLPAEQVPNGHHPDQLLMAG
jgi:hypothetical protein